MSETPAPAQPAVDASNGAQSTTEVAVEPGFKVFAGNLTYATDEAALKNFFASYTEDILSTQIVFRGQRSAGFGFIAFKTEDVANKVVESLNKTELDGRPIILEHARPKGERGHPRRKFGGRRGTKAVPGEATEAKPNGEEHTGDEANGTPAEGEAAAPRPKRKSHKRKSRKAPVAAEGATPGESANGSAEGEGTQRHRRSHKPRGPKRPRREPTGEPSKTVLFIANLAFTVDEAALTEFFKSNGITINSARVVRRRFGLPRKSKGYAFVDVGNEEEQKKAIEAVQGKSLEDREITIKVAVGRDPRTEADEAQGAQVAVEDAHIPDVAAAA